MLCLTAEFRLWCNSQQSNSRHGGLDPPSPDKEKLRVLLEMADRVRHDGKGLSTVGFYRTAIILFVGISSLPYSSLPFAMSYLSAKFRLWRNSQQGNGRHGGLNPPSPDKEKLRVLLEMADRVRHDGKGLSAVGFYRTIGRGLKRTLDGSNISFDTST